MVRWMLHCGQVVLDNGSIVSSLLEDIYTMALSVKMAFYCRDSRAKPMVGQRVHYSCCDKGLHFFSESNFRGALGLHRMVRAN